MLRTCLLHGLDPLSQSRRCWSAMFYSSSDPTDHALALKGLKPCKSWTIKQLPENSKFWIMIICNYLRFGKFCVIILNVSCEGLPVHVLCTHWWIICAKYLTVYIRGYFKKKNLNYHITFLRYRPQKPTYHMSSGHNGGSWTQCNTVIEILKKKIERDVFA